MIEQTSIFDFINEKYRITKKIRLIELFAGIGSQAKALERLNANFEKYRVVEFDKYAIASYNAIHGTNFPTMDVTKITGKDLGIVETDKYEYILFYSFPCTDISLAGKCAGMEKGSGTRSSLLWEVERLLNELEVLPQRLLNEVDALPQCLIMENVTQIHSKKNFESFNTWLSFLESKGYKNYWQDLNAKDYGIPQNRNRTFVVSVLDGKYDFPKKIPLTKKLKDMLDDDVDEKYYLSDKMLNFFTENSKKNKEKGNGFRFSPTNGERIAKTITTRSGNRMDDNFILENGIIEDLDKTTNVQECVHVKKTINPIYLNSKGGRKGVDGLQPSRKDRIYDSESVAVTIATSEFYNPAYLVDENYLMPNLRIRKLTPKECFRLMGFDDHDYEKVKAVPISDAQLYKQAGNSIVVDVLMAIFKEML